MPASTRKPLRRRATTVDDLDDALLTRVLARLASPHWLIGDGRFLSHFQRSVRTFKVYVDLYEGYAGVSGDLGTATTFVLGSERWCRGKRWRRAGRATDVHLSGANSIHFVGRYSARFYWRMNDDDDHMLVHSGYNYNTFSLVALPEAMKGRRLDCTSAFRIVAGGDGNVRIVWLEGGVLSVFARLRKQWLLEKRLQLPAHAVESYIGDNAVIADAGAGRILLIPAEDKRRVVSVELATMKIDEPKHGRNSRCDGVPCPYELPWPPTLNACFNGQWSPDEG